MVIRPPSCGWLPIYALGPGASGEMTYGDAGEMPRPLDASVRAWELVWESVVQVPGAGRGDG